MGIYLQPKISNRKEQEFQKLKEKVPFISVGHVRLINIKKELANQVFYRDWIKWYDQQIKKSFQQEYNDYEMPDVPKIKEAKIIADFINRNDEFTITSQKKIKDLYDCLDDFFRDKSELEKYALPDTNIDSFFNFLLELKECLGFCIKHKVPFKCW